MTTFVHLPEDQRQFLDYASTALEEFRPTPLDHSNARDLETFCHNFATEFLAKGYRPLYSVAKTAREIAAAFSYATTHAQRTHCTALFKETLFFIHTHLYRIVVQDETTESTLQLVRLLSKCRKFLDSLKTAQESPAISTTPATSPSTTTTDFEPDVTQVSASLTTTTNTTTSTNVKKSYAVFRVAQRRYAIDLSYVVSVGSLGIENRLTKTVATPDGKATLQDLKKLLGVYGETGNVYITVNTPSGLTAWMVDGLEGMKHDTSFEVRPIQIVGRPTHARLTGILEGFVKEHSHTPPIFIINPGYLKAIKTPSRGH